MNLLLRTTMESFEKRSIDLLLELLLVLLFCCYRMYLIMYVLESPRAMHEIRRNFKRGPPAGNTCMERISKSCCRTLHDTATRKKYQHETS